MTAPCWKSLWTLDPAIVFLNHGSFGACPRAVLDYQQQLRSQLEAEPVRFFALELEPLLDQARQALADFVGANPADLVFVPNATAGVNTVLRSLCSPLAGELALRPGDQLLTTNHEYNASRNALNFAAAQSGATVVVADVPFPIDTPEQIITAVLDRVTNRTRLVLLDHVTSQTGLIFPIESLIKTLTQQGIDTLIDGAHAPGMVPLDLQTLGATFYTGNCHKWLCSPKGAAFLYVTPDRQSLLRPLAISHGANSPRTDRSRFHLEFDWTGTADPTPYLTVPAALNYMGNLLPGGWSDLMAQNRSQARVARTTLCATLGVSPPSPDTMIGAMAVLPLPDGSAERLQTRLFQELQIEVPVIPGFASGQRWLRISAQLYNTQTDYDVLARALMQLLAETELAETELAETELAEIERLGT